MIQRVFARGCLHSVLVSVVTLKRSVSMSSLGTLTALTCRVGLVSTALSSLQMGVTHRVTGWVVPSSWLST